MKIVINSCFGGFSLSPKALKKWAERKGRKAFFYRDRYTGNGTRVYQPFDPETVEKRLFYTCFDTELPKLVMPDAELNKFWAKHNIYDRDIERNDPDLVAVVEEMHDEASGACAKLRVVEIPDGVDWEIDEYDGNERIAEKHRTWH